MGFWWGFLIGFIIAGMVGVCLGGACGLGKARDLEVENAYLKSLKVKEERK